LGLLDGGAVRFLDGLSKGQAAHDLFSASVENGAPQGRPVSGLVSKATIEGGAEATFTFALSWHFPNQNLNGLGKVGRYYAGKFTSAADVVDRLRRPWASEEANEASAANQTPMWKSLYEQTKLWHDTWYDSTLPYWLLDRVMGNNATLATSTSNRFANGRFYGWEGIGCCEGTCGHVYAYAQGMARLFPDLERTVREMVDFGLAFHPDTGIIEFRGEFGNGYATDAQGGYVLRAYREHQMSRDAEFLKRIWPQAKKALQFLIEQDGNADGIIENSQHNTLDVNLEGASSWLSSIYLAALRAGEQMALEMDDQPFAAQCRSIADAGIKNIVDKLWNGEYFIQKLDLKSNKSALRYGDGCEVDQVMGQWWAWQLGLGRVIDHDHSKAALAALYRNNFLTDVGPYRAKMKPGRWYATAGEAGLLMCTFPRGDREKILGNGPTWASMYFNECMTGFEYEAAAHMISEGLVEEGLAVTRAVHDRYHPSKRNPWNEVECSDHYARCMAVHGVFIAAGGYECHGPKGHIGFAPRIHPEDFRAPFTAATGWGTYSQKISGSEMSVTYEIKHGSLRLNTIALELPEAQVAKATEIRLGRALVSAGSSQVGRRLLLTGLGDLSVRPGSRVSIQVSLSSGSQS
jgi:uncharacterized protein (DUF608 family)